jgi:hypothetical protein
MSSVRMRFGARRITQTLGLGLLFAFLCSAETKLNILVTLGDDVRAVEHQRLHPRLGGISNTEYRPDHQRRNDVYRLLCGELLYSRPVNLHYRTGSVAHGIVQGRIAVNAFL